MCSPQVNDGSNMSGLQVVAEPGVAGWQLLEDGTITTGLETFSIYCIDLQNIPELGFSLVGTQSRHIIPNDFSN